MPSTSLARRVVSRSASLALGPLAVLAVLVALAGGARAQTVTLTFDDANLQPINDTFKVNLDYNLPAAYYQNLEIVLPLPDRGVFPVTTYVSQSAPGTFAFSTTTTPNGRLQTLKWSAGTLAANEAITGRITVTVKFESFVQYYDAVSVPAKWRVYSTLSGTPFPFAATLSGSTSATEGGVYAPTTISSESVQSPRWPSRRRSARCGALR